MRRNDVEETRPLESSQIRKRCINPLTATSSRLDSRTNDGSRAIQVRVTSKRIKRAARHALWNPGGLLAFHRDVPASGRHRGAAKAYGRSVREKGIAEGVDTGTEESGQIGGHMGKEVRVPRASRRGGFAPVSPGGFIEPHIAWYGVPATVLYAMYQNAADPRPSLVRKL